ncbi:winged helix-turn-helix transcriptional regulator [Anaerosalibacter bizertensis]|uniref:Metalloregulator ArsR/SmtB family transcription factor n=1 Tax=Anaerosalibacter bizertensis TaxID=932217 RepID=A0A844FEB5_9FIRM|nr:metalloregulator ArsR/SmtB family transcription factor [Anaerosalibacter bizertensis]MBV1817102.1 metalloregulator ArsR/SmtB family transcription factor [Bacteroidales bacterium MSK.15.36]HHV27833.1 winged helix-turn-helix transcriptional regulator [Tissierellia bacterium]MCB5558922.1 metalloregulator ArsR/SmtB family transcription factor [Anaerosalibacter bizertensis]MCG4564867.1 metalloregulator ArsR/SmtB family transcription factor [Anaerosalibacter bizertensis]MCG4581598.1 metalloregula
MDELTNYFKLLSDETRLRIMVLLYHRELCVCQLCGITGISQPNISKHLGRLRDSGLVKDERKEQYIFYSLNMKDKLFENILKNIVGNVEEYPILKSDIEKSKSAEKYIELANMCK